MHVAKLLCTLSAVVLLDGCHLIHTHRALPATTAPAATHATALPASTHALRWDGNSRNIHFSGTPAQQKQALDSVLAHTGDSETTSLLLAANTALKLKRLEDAGFLYNAAQIRRTADLARFPPLPEERDWLQRMDALRIETGNHINTSLLDEPASYVRVVKRLSRWSCETGKGYLPSWRSQRQNTDSDCRPVGKERVRAMQDVATLMAIPEYAEAAQLAKYYVTSSASVRSLPGLKARYQKALAEMQRIEQDKGLKGLSGRMR